MKKWSLVRTTQEIQGHEVGDLIVRNGITELLQVKRYWNLALSSLNELCTKFPRLFKVRIMKWSPTTTWQGFSTSAKSNSFESWAERVLLRRQGNRHILLSPSDPLSGCLADDHHKTKGWATTHWKADLPMDLPSLLPVLILLPLPTHHPHLGANFTLKEESGHKKRMAVSLCLSVRRIHTHTSWIWYLC